MSINNIGAADVPQPTNNDYVSNSNTASSPKKAGSDGSVLVKDSSEIKRDMQPKEIEQMASDVQIQLKRLNTELRLEVDKKSKNVVIKIFDPNTKQMIRQIPSEELMAIRERMNELIGVLYKGQS